MKSEQRRTCPTCGNRFSRAIEFCPVCMITKAIESRPDKSYTGNMVAAPEYPASRFEHYELERDEDGKPLELGRGGMGVTYKAFDINLRVVVALKVITEKYLRDESAHRRFLREARTAAGVRHPNVASVFHLGRVGENYFYAMEFVEGETLERLVDRSGPLDVKPALDIATQVAAGLAAVHRQKLVHRDIKPGNIMVSFEGTGAVSAKIIDLGLAKPVNEPGAQTTISLPGWFAGTPEFASPEQFAGVGVDIRSDLYSLGATLWKSMTGDAVFTGSPAEVMYQHQHAPLPLEKLKGVPQPVAVLLERLLEKDPASRFQTPVELLNAMPTIRGAIDTGCTITGANLQKALDGQIGLYQKPTGALFPYDPAKHQFDESRKEHSLNLRRGVKSWGAFVALLLFLCFALGIWLLQRQQHSSQQIQALQEKFDKLQQGVDSFAEVQNRVRQERPGQKPDELQQRTYEELGRQLGLDTATLKRELPRFAQELKKATNATTYERANAAYVAKDYKESERLALTAADEAESDSPPKNSEAIKAFELAASAAAERIEYADALKRLRAAEKLTDRTRDAIEWARVQFAIARILDDQGQYADAEHILREVLNERERVLGPEHPDTLTTRNSLATVLGHQGKDAEAETEYRAVLQLKEKMLGPEHPDTLMTRHGLANVLDKQGKYAQAEPEYRAVIKLRERVLGPEHPDTLATRNNLGIVLYEQGKYAEAETEYRAVIELREKVLGPEHPDTLATRNNLGIVLFEQAKYAEAETEFRTVLKLKEKVLGPEHPITLGTRNNLGEVLDHQAKYAEAETEFRTVIKLKEKVLGPEHPDTLLTRDSLAEVLDHQGKYAEAETEFRAVLQAEEKVLGPERPETLGVRTKLAEVLDHQSKYAEADTEFRAVLQAEEKVLGLEHPGTLRTYFDLADCSRSQNEIQQARLFAQRAADGARKVLGPEHPDTKKYEQLQRELQAKKD